MKLPGRTDLGFRSRSRTYTLIIGIVTAMLAAGLAVPFVFGTPLDTASTAAPSRLVANNGATASGAAGADATAAAEAASSAAGSAAGPGGGTAAGSSPLAGGSAAVDGLTASDRGVTATTITIAFLLVDLGGVSKVGFSVPGFDVQSQETYINTFLDNVNNHGGIFGRKIVPVFVTYDPTNQSTSTAACRTATQDHEIFAAIDSAGGLNDPGMLCFTQQNHTPLIGVGAFGTAPEMYQQAGGYLFTVDASGLRALANMASLLDARGVLKGKKIGIVDRDFPGTLQTVTDGLIAILEQLGYQIAYRADLSSDDGTAASQVPVAAQQMSAHGVDTVFLLTDFIIGSEFVQAADKSAYRPLYLASDFESMTNDTAVQSMPPAFQAIGVTASRIGEWRVGLPEPAVDAACREIYAGATGTNPQRSENAYGGMDLACGLVDLVVRGTTAAGPDLTRDNYVAGLQQIGSIDFPFFGGFSYRPGKYDGGDPVRTLAYDSSCTCWLPQGDFVAPRY
ncbi:MAG: hypothetical protein QOG30_3221 [Acidimicrobiaceae bacterium]